MNPKTKIILYALILVLFVVGLAFILISVFGGKPFRWTLPVGMILVLIGNIVNLVRVIKIRKNDNNK